jgi:uncharacterized protein
VDGALDLAAAAGTVMAMPNRLSRSTSPYLLQHQDNPVEWYEWGQEAFDAARERDVPILLSVGYSACHWCHVMAHESFEDEATAAVMNERFVNVKVDREERPDVDAVYMEAVQATTGRGGWPMTVWLTPGGEPFYAGTYFPSEDRHGMPSFAMVMQAIAEAWTERREAVADQARRLTDAISGALPAPDDLPGEDTLAAAYRTLEASFDPVHGGFGGAPKFPQQPVLEYLLRIHEEPWAPRAGAMVRQTLIRMARGGIHDHLAGGFARYSVDSVWLVPHFEKMLYDNAQLARLYLWAWVELGEERFREVAESTLDYLLRYLRHPDGGFFSAEDADSEGVEGKFYVWSLDELLSVAGPEDGPMAATHFGVTPGGNFEGATILHEARSVTETGEEHGIAPEEAAAALDRARVRLLEQRDRRIRPGLDDKVLASWNGLAIRAFAEAGAVLGREDHLEAARTCARFVLDRMTRDDGRLVRAWAKGRPGAVPGFLDDYAAMATGLFALYQATGELEWYRRGSELTRSIPDRFTDPAGGFFTSGDDAEQLVKRPKDQMDNPLPSGNSLAAEALVHLSLLTGDEGLRSLAEGTIRAGSPMIERYPSAVGHLLSVLHTLHRGPKEVAVTGPDARLLAATIWRRFRPHVALALDETGDSAPIVPLLSGRWRAGRTLAHVCERFACELPVDRDEDLVRLLG